MKQVERNNKEDQTVKIGRDITQLVLSFTNFHTLYSVAKTSRRLFSLVATMPKNTIYNTFLDWQQQQQQQYVTNLQPKSTFLDVRTKTIQMPPTILQMMTMYIRVSDDGKYQQQHQQHQQQAPFCQVCNWNRQTDIYWEFFLCLCAHCRTKVVIPEVSLPLLKVPPSCYGHLIHQIINGIKFYMRKSVNQELSRHALYSLETREYMLSNVRRSFQERGKPPNGFVGLLGCKI